MGSEIHPEQPEYIELYYYTGWTNFKFGRVSILFDMKLYINPSDTSSDFKRILLTGHRTLPYRLKETPSNSYSEIRIVF